MAQEPNQVYRLKAVGIENVVLSEESIVHPGRGEVLLRMRAISLNYRDLAIAQGTFIVAVAPDRIPLSDGAGEVVELGEGVTKFKVGDRVTSNFVSQWVTGPVSQELFATALGGPIDGVGRKYAVLREESLVLIPPHLSYEEAATLPCAAMVAWNALFEGPKPILPGQSVLIIGTGGVSIFATQLALLAGARVIITSSSDEKLAKAKALGAHTLINYKTHPDWEKEVLKATNNKGVEHVVEIGGIDTLPRSIVAVAQNGVITVVGGVSGFNGALPAAALIKKTPIVRGVLIGSREMYERLHAAVGLHSLRPIIDKVYDFGQLKEALQYLKTGAHFGKIVLKIA